MTPVERTGQFRALITDYGLTESKDGAVGIAIKARLLEWFDPTGQGDGGAGAWAPWEQYEMEAEGVLWVVKKNGEINELAAKSLVAHANWDGNLLSITNGAWQPTQCQVSVEKDTYKNETRFRIGFVNDYHRNPLGMSSVGMDKASELQARFGSSLRAIAGNAKRNVPPQNGQPPAPPAPAATPAPVADLPPPPPGRSYEDIPFAIGSAVALLLPFLTLGA